MAAINRTRVFIGTLAGGVVWTIWSVIVNVYLLAPHYEAAQQHKLLLEQPRYTFFIGQWILTLFLLSCVIAWLYASVRATQGAGPSTALLLGLSVGFVAGFPMNFSLASWASFDRVLPLWWMLDLWVGAVLAALVAGWLYKD